MTWHEERRVPTDRYKVGPRSRYIDSVVNSYGTSECVSVPRVRLERLADELAAVITAIANDESLPADRVHLVIRELRDISKPHLGLLEDRP